MLCLDEAVNTISQNITIYMDDLYLFGYVNLHVPFVLSVKILIGRFRSRSYRVIHLFGGLLTLMITVTWRARWPEAIERHFQEETSPRFEEEERSRPRWFVTSWRSEWSQDCWCGASKSCNTSLALSFHWSTHLFWHHQVWCNKQSNKKNPKQAK